MINLYNEIEKRPDFLSFFLKIQENNLKSYEEHLNYIKKSGAEFSYVMDTYLTEDEIDVFYQRTKYRIRGTKKLMQDFKEDSPKASPYKIFFLSALADREHWYRTDVDSSMSSLSVLQHLNTARAAIESRPPKPDDKSWNKIREDYPDMAFTIINSIENAKNTLESFVNNNLSYSSQKYWQICRFFELYDTVEFDNDNDLFSEPKSPTTPLHPTDTFVEYQIDPSEFHEKLRHKYVLLENLEDIREEAFVRTHMLNKKIEAKLEVKKNNSMKP